MITLALETSTPRGGVAVFLGEELVFEENFTADRSHSAELFAVIERGLKGMQRPGRLGWLAVYAGSIAVMVLTKENAFFATVAMGGLATTSCVGS